MTPLQMQTLAFLETLEMPNCATRQVFRGMGVVIPSSTFSEFKNHSAERESFARVLRAIADTLVEGFERKSTEQSFPASAYGHRWHWRMTHCVNCGVPLNEYEKGAPFVCGGVDPKSLERKSDMR